MDENSFREWSRRAANWGVDYRRSLPEKPVRPRMEPGAVFRSIEASPPE